jgi:hypothetical protein
MKESSERVKGVKIMAGKLLEEKKLILEVASDILIAHIEVGLHGISIGNITKGVEKAYDSIGDGTTYSDEKEGKKKR